MRKEMWIVLPKVMHPIIAEVEFQPRFTDSKAFSPPCCGSRILRYTFKEGFVI